MEIQLQRFLQSELDLKVVERVQLTFLFMSSLSLADAQPEMQDKKPAASLSKVDLSSIVSGQARAAIDEKQFTGRDAETGDSFLIEVINYPRKTVSCNLIQAVSGHDRLRMNKQFSGWKAWLEPPSCFAGGDHIRSGNIQSLGGPYTGEC